MEGGEGGERKAEGARGKQGEKGELDKIQDLMYTFPGVGYVHPRADSSAKSNSRISSQATER